PGPGPPPHPGPLREPGDPGGVPGRPLGSRESGAGFARRRSPAARTGCRIVRCATAVPSHNPRAGFTAPARETGRSPGLTSIVAQIAFAHQPGEGWHRAFSLPGGNGCASGEVASTTTRESARAVEEV